jgi:hypothetical protein
MALRSLARCAGYFFRDLILSNTIPTIRRRGCTCGKKRRSWYGQIGGGNEAWEIAADSRYALQWNGARCTSTCLLTSSGPKGVARHHQRGGVSRREERRCLAAWILKISRRRQTMHGGFWRKASVPRGTLELATVTLPCRATTHYRQTGIISNTASSAERGGSHSKQGCSTEARTTIG